MNIRIINIRYYLPALIFVVYCISGFSQDTSLITLEKLYHSLDENHPDTRQIMLTEEISKKQIDNIISDWYPSVSLNGQASWQSDVIEIGGVVQIPDVTFPEVPHDQYKLTVDIQQPVYDGGAMKYSRSIEERTNEVEKQQLVVDRYKQKEIVNQLFFSIILMNKNNEILDTILLNLQDREKAVRAAVSAGALEQSDLLALQTEILNMSMKQDEIQSTKSAAKKSLIYLTGMHIPEKSVFYVPVSSGMEMNDSINRPENRLFYNQKDLLDASIQMVKSNMVPKIYAFSQIGYGKPGLNMMNDEFDSFILVGAQFSWNFLNWNDNKRQKQILQIQKDMVDSQEESFLIQTRMALTNELENLKKYEKAVSKGEIIVDNRKQITLNAAVKLENGAISSSDYLGELNSELQARLDLEKSKLLLMQSLINYKTLKGDF